MTFLRHLAIRIWISIFIWMFIAVWILPLLQILIGIQWLFIPAGLLFFCIYVLTGFAMERLGRDKINKLIYDAGVWERAGMTRDTANALDSAVDLYDSFLFSSKSKKSISEKLLVKVARHRLARRGRDIANDESVLAYLNRFPTDKDAGRIWVRAALKMETLPPRHSDLINKLSQSQADNEDLQSLLGRVYLSERRTDFEALQVYRRVLAGDGFSDAKFFFRLANLLALNGQTDEWALKIYIKAHSLKPSSKTLLDAILACYNSIGSQGRRRPLLLKAQALLIKHKLMSAPPQRAIEDTLQPQIPPTKSLKYEEEDTTFIMGELDDTLIPTQASATNLIQKEYQQVGKNPVSRLWYAVKKFFKSKISSIKQFLSFKKKLNAAVLIRGGVILAILGGVIFLGSTFTDHILMVREQPKPPPPIAPQAKISEPYTLQVGAYMSQNDAKKYMQRLKDHNLQAYLTLAKGREKRWYQVRISHFSNHKEAISFGEALKSQGIIADYYVANYKPPFEP